jgi:hypothetical protein
MNDIVTWNYRKATILVVEDVYLVDSFEDVMQGPVHQATVFSDTLHAQLRKAFIGSECCVCLTRTRLNLKRLSYLSVCQHGSIVTQERIIEDRSSKSLEYILLRTCRFKDVIKCENTFFVTILGQDDPFTFLLHSRRWYLAHYDTILCSLLIEIFLDEWSHSHRN